MGPKVTEYLNQSDDHILGLRPLAGSKRFIGNSETHIKGGSFVIKGVTYEGIDGLLALLPKKVVPENIKILHEDFKYYGKILTSTNANHHNIR
jgi:hypothetical protein